MDKVEDKKLEALVDKMMGGMPLESPSRDFTQSVMAKIEAQESKEVFQYRPIMSKRALFTVFAAFAALLIAVGFQLGPESGQGWFKNLNMENWFHADWSWMEGFTFSKVTVYAFLFLGLMFFVQVSLLKKQLGRRVY
ncbi:hypothetical protein [Flagellimonas crocea]|uniref:hypothetical protein n=1 Tax=Flagellimonas crocea TaxID=3067311 RepID=UPI00296F70F3|nr:hypothetical protein [Muricauda sp. DH64]